MLEREKFGAVERLTLNHPQKYNPLSSQMLTILQDAFDEIAKDQAINVVVLAARGKAFCAGHDLREMQNAKDNQQIRQLFDQCSRMMLTMTRMPQPVIACVQGIATAAGCQLVANSDLAVASSEAQFAVSGVNLGLFCSTPSVPLSRNIARKHALEMLFTGEFIDAFEAKENGLINRIADPDTLEHETMELAQTIAGKPRDVLELGKQLFYRQIETGLEDAYQIASERMACNMTFDSAIDGISAFTGK